MRILLISGSWPPESCGVGHYSSKLAEFLANSVEVLKFRTDYRSSFPTVLRDIYKAKPDLIHVQYPTVGYRRSIIPSLLALSPRVPTVVTLHEFSIFRWYRAPWFIPFKFADALIFTNHREKQAFEGRFGAGGHYTRVIPIGSNIPIGRPTNRHPRGVCYFGLLMPGKGLEDFLHLAELLKKRDFKMTVMGAIPNGFEGYAEQIIEQSKRLEVEICLNRSDAEVADLLQANSYAYLPFPDGASDKRGSLIAALENGVIVLTSYTEATNDWIRSATLVADSALDASRRLIELTEMPSGGRNLIGSPETRPSFDWHKIAEAHVALYQSLVDRSVRAGAQSSNP